MSNKNLFINNRQKTEKKNEEAFLLIIFQHNYKIYLGIFLNVRQTCLGRNHVPASLSQFSATSHHCLKRALFQISVASILEKRNNHWVLNLGGMGVTPDFSFEFLSQFLSLASNIKTEILMQGEDTITQHGRTHSLPERNESLVALSNEDTFPKVLPFQSI